MLNRICILLNYFTTAAIDAMLNFKPILFLDNAIYKLPNWNTNDQHNHIHKVENINSLEFYIDKLLSDENFVNIKLNSANKLLNIILGDTKNKALNNLEIFIKNKFHNDSKNKLIDLQYYNTLYSSFKKCDLLDKKRDLIPMYIFIYASLSIYSNLLFPNRLFRLNRCLNKYKYSFLLKNYIYGSNAGNSIENIKSLSYLFLLLIYNIDLLFKKSYFKNREVQKYLYRQIFR